MARRILAIRPRALGDVVLTTPALRALRRGHPDARIDLVTARPYVPLLAGQPGLDRVWAEDRTTLGTLALVRRLRRERYDLAVDFFGNPRSAFLTAWCGAPATAGYELRGRRRAYRVRVPRVVPGPGGRAEYAAATHLRLAEAVGGIADGVDVRLVIQPTARAAADRVLEQAGIADPAVTVGLVPVGTWATKTWPLSHFMVLARRLIDAGHPVLALVGPGEEGAAERLRRMVPRVASLPPCSVDTLAAVIARLRAVVGTDSGPRHLAAAFGVPTYAWFGPGLPGIWTLDEPRHGVWFTELPCRGCNRTRCPHWSCLPGLSPEHALSRVLAHLERHARPAADLGPAARA